MSMLLLVLGMATFGGGEETLLLSAFPQGDGTPVGLRFNAGAEMIPSAPVASHADSSRDDGTGCALFEVDCSLSEGSHGLVVIPLEPADVSGHRYVRLWIKTRPGAYYRLAVRDDAHEEMAFDGFWGTSSNLHYDGPWGTRRVCTEKDWHAVEIDLDHTVQSLDPVAHTTRPFDRIARRLTGVAIEVYGPKAPYAAWGGPRERFTVKLDTISLATRSLTPSANKTHKLPERRLPLMVGIEAHGTATIDFVKDQGLGNFVWIPTHNYVMGDVPWDHEHTLWDDIEACNRNGLYFWVSGRRGLGDRFRAGGGETGGHGSGEWYRPAELTAIADRGGERFVGALAEEMDADFIQEDLRPSFRARLPHIYGFTDAAGGRAAFEGELTRIRKRYHELGIPFLPTLCITHHHSGFRIGADMVIAELFEHLPTTELQLAYLRGGSQQFGQDWGIWVSPWYKGQVPCSDKSYWTRPQATVGGGHSSAMFRRALYLSYVSGSRLFVPQNIEPIYAPDGKGGFEPVLWGSELQAFWAYVREHDAELDPMVSLGILMDKDNGWEPPNLWGGWRIEERQWAILPTDRYPDGSFREYLNVLLPGFMRTEKSYEAEHSDDLPGYFAATPHGPFDIVASDIRAERLYKYPTVALLGGINMTPHLLGVLKDYVHQGGTLLLNALQMYNRATLLQSPDFLGAEIRPDIGSASRIHVVADAPGLKKAVYEGPRFSTLTIKLGAAEVVAVDDSGPGRPVLVRHGFGTGYVEPAP